MASIRKRGENFGAQFRVPCADGTWKLVSVTTNTGDAREAKRHAEIAEQGALKALAADRTHGMRYCDVLLDAIRDAGASRLTESKAREYLSRITEIARGRALISYSVKIWLNEFLVLKKPNLAASTYSAYKWCYDSFIEFLGPRANAGIEHVEIPDIRAWRDAQKASGLSDKRVNNLLKYLSGPFTKAAKSGMIPINPVAATETLRVSDSVDRKPFSEDEVIKLLAHCPSDEWKLVLLLGVYCGMRLGDAAKRLVDDFDLTNGTVAFIPEKKKRHQRVITLPLHASVRSAVTIAAASAKEQEEKFLTPTLASNQIGGKTGLSSQFLRIMEAAEVDRGTSIQGSGRGRTRFARSFHSTRHTAATWLANAGVEEDLRMLLTDHESREVAKRYTHHSIELLRKAVSKMPMVDDSSSH